MLDRDLMRKAAEEAIRVFAERDPELRDALDMTCGMVADPSAVLALLESERRLTEQIAVMQPVYEAVQEIPLGSDGRFWEFVCRSLMETGEEGSAIAAESIRGWINKLESACGQALADPPTATEGGAG